VALGLEVVGTGIEVVALGLDTDALGLEVDGLGLWHIELVQPDMSPVLSYLTMNALFNVAPKLTVLPATA
jgi:hypothetical protein